MNCPRQSRVRKQISRALAKQYRLNERLEEGNISLRRKLTSVRKKSNRLEIKQRQNRKPEALTPNGKAKEFMEENRFYPGKASAIQKKLVFAECLTA